MNKGLKIILVVFAVSMLSTLGLKAQQPVPAQPQSKPLLLMNGTAHIGNGTVIKNAVVGFKNGKITLVADVSKFSQDKSEYEVIDVSGKDIYPGFIAPNTILGLSEIELVRSTLDFRETGSMNENVRALISYNTDSKVIPTVRYNGILLAQVVPQGGTVSGQSSVMELDAWNWEDAAYNPDEGLHLNWPLMFIYKGAGPEAEEAQRTTADRELKKIKMLFSEAKAYCASDPTEKNLRFEAMRGLFNKTKRLYIHCDYVKEIVSAVNFAHDLGLNMVLVGGADSWRVTALLRSYNVPVIVGRTHALPSREDDDVDLPYKLPYLLQRDGVAFCLSVDGFWQVRNLPFMAGTAVAYGLTKEEALQSITSAPAKIFGIADRCGTLEPGKDATLIVSNGDALDMKSNRIEHAFIRGKSIQLTSIQTDLNSKYRSKYGLKP